MNTPPRSCLLIGEGPLLSQCVDYLKVKGFRLSAIISDNSFAELSDAVSVLAWPNDQAIDELCARYDFDYLLSINNLEILPDTLLEQSNVISINLHDGPLPEVSGINAPIWALLSGEQDHGVCWHQMTREVNAGPILVDQRFPLEPDETALSLNAKCYEQAFTSFKVLVEHMLVASFDTRPQDLAKGQRYLQNDRPPHLGLIDYRLTAEENLSRFRALSTSPYSNTLCLPKLCLAERVLIVSQMEFVETAGEPGLMIPVAEGVIINCQQGALLCRELQDSLGHAVTVDQQQLLAIDDGMVADLAATLGKMDAFWLDRLAKKEPTQCPYVKAGVVTDQPWESVELVLSGQSQSQIIAALSAYFARLTQGPVTTPLFGMVADSKLLNSHLVYDHGFIVSPTTLDQPYEQWQQQMVDEFARVSEVPLVSIDLAHKLACLVDLLGAQYQLAFYLEMPVEEQFKALLNMVVAPSGCITFYAKEPQLAKSLSMIVKEIECFIGRINEQPIAVAPLLIETELSELNRWNDTQRPFSQELIHQAIAEQISKDPDRIALVFHDERWSYQMLDSVSNKIANALIFNDIKPGDRVGLMVGRSCEMVACQLAILKAGACFVPMSPEYPKGRLQHMADDGGLSCVIVDQDYGLSLTVNQLFVANLKQHDNQQPTDVEVASDDLAYMIYTSGSTGKPKGVMIEHRQVANFFVGMDGCIPVDSKADPTWLAVTSMSFDISILELLWTLTRGFTVVIYDGSDTSAEPTQVMNMSFGLFYWNVATTDVKPGREAYQLLLEGARFADANGFQAIWTPERHFGEFGGLYPNAAITCAAVATITENISIRAGSCVLPLHHPVRVAEDWALIDNLSNGRAGISIAPGWMPNDFVIRPENYENAKQVMFDGIDELRTLWRGESVTYPGPKGDVEVVTLPRPVQPELPLWLTTAGNPDNFIKAGQMGANLLTHLLGQTLEEVAEKIQLYRNAWREAGHKGQGTVSLMLHTFVGETDEQAKTIAREPMKNYLKTALFLVEAAAWDFPAFKKMSEEQGKSLDEFFASIEPSEMDALLDFAFERYYQTSGLLGSVEQCVERIKSVKQAGVDDIACLIDYGIEPAIVLEHLQLLNQVRAQCNQAVPTETRGLARLLAEHDITHLQCTPSMARLMLADETISQGLDSVGTLLVGGEALPLELANTLSEKIQGKLINMYGPTETTIWSTTKTIVPAATRITIGSPIANTQVKIVDGNNQVLPIGLPGELLIGGLGVVRGYWQKPELTAERFIELEGERFYRTGDLARMSEDGSIEYLGRTDFMMKIRGCTVELGEIESRLVAHDSVSDAAVVAQSSGGEPRLVAFVTEVIKGAVDVGVLKAHLETTLTDFMVPSSIHTIDVMPLTPNAKIDRNRLPDMSVKQVKTAPQAASSGAEKIIIDIWCELLERDDIGANDNFFSLGGHSLLVVPMMSKLRQHFTRPIKLTDLFRFPTVSGLAAYLDSTDGNQQAEKQVATAAQNRAAARRSRRKS